jgi:hypothetical protein
MTTDGQQRLVRTISHQCQFLSCLRLIFQAVSLLEPTVKAGIIMPHQYLMLCLSLQLVMFQLCHPLVAQGDITERDRELDVSILHRRLS